jgi:hypothetical protein
MDPLLLPHASRLRPGLSRLGSVAIWLGILPFFLLCWYAHPSADDLLQANDVAKHGHLGYLKYMYLFWTGRYTATVGWSFLNPVSYGELRGAYVAVCFLLLLALLGALVLALRALLRGAGFSARQLWQVGAGAFLLLAYHLPSTAESFYWLTAGFNYLLPAILLLLAVAALAAAVHPPLAARSRYVGTAALLLFLAVGCNETIAIPLLLTTWAVVAVAFWEQRRLAGRPMALALAVSAGCAVAFLAPGNTARLHVEGGEVHGVLASAVATLKFTVYCLVNWLGSGILVVVTLLLVPAFARLARLPELPLNQLAQRPVFLTLLVPAFLAAGFFPGFWVTGMPSPPRAQNLLYICFILSWLLAAYAWVFWAVQRSGVSFHLPAFVRGALLAWLPFTFLTDYRHHLNDPGYRWSTNNSLLAYRDLLHGSASRYNAELTARYRYLRSTPELKPQVQPLTDPSITLLFSDITPDTADWSNRAYADFFHKKTIVVRPAAAPQASLSR